LQGQETATLNIFNANRMTARLILLGSFTAILIFIAFMGLMFGEILPFPVSGSLIGLIAIGYTVWSHVRFKRADHFLVFEQPLRTARAVNLNELESWKELGYNIRGQRRRSLLLFIPGNPRIVIDNGTYADEFENVYLFLKENFQAKQIK
jgi:hypothetical protein